MFTTKINSIESQIAQLTEQLNQYRTLESELEQTKVAIARIKTAASELGVSDEVEAACGLSSNSNSKVEEYEAKLVNRELQVSRLEEQFAAVAKERDEKNSEIRDLRNAIALLEEKLESQQDDELGATEEEEFLAIAMGISEEEARASLFTEPVQLGLPSIEVDSLVQVPDGQVGRVIYLKDEMVTVKLPSGPANFHLPNLRYVSKYEPTPVEQILQSKTWNEMRAIALDNPELLTEAIKLQPNLMQQLPTQIATYINATGNAEDLDKLPRMLGESVRVILARFEQKETVPASDVPYSKIQETARDLFNFRTWAQMRAVMQGFAPATKSEILKEMAKTATNKTKTKFIENLPSLIAKYCEKGVRTDLNWLPQTLAERVEQLLLVPVS